MDLERKEEFENSRYYKDMRHEILPEQEMKWYLDAYIAWGRKDIALRNKIAKYNLRHAALVSNNMYDLFKNLYPDKLVNKDPDDFIQEWNIWLINAVEKFDPKKWSFGGYSEKCITSSIFAYMAKYFRNGAFRWFKKAVRLFDEKFFAENWRYPNDEEWEKFIDEYNKTNNTNFYKTYWYFYKSLFQSDISLYQPVNQSGPIREAVLWEDLFDPNHYDKRRDPFEEDLPKLWDFLLDLEPNNSFEKGEIIELFKSEIKKAMIRPDDIKSAIINNLYKNGSNLLKKLSKLESKVLKLYYWIGSDSKPMTIWEIAESLWKTAAQIDKTKSKALSKLKIHRIPSALTNEEYEVLKLYYWLDSDFEPMDIEDIAEHLWEQNDKISRIKSSALKKLRNRLNLNKVIAKELAEILD